MGRVTSKLQVTLPKEMADQFHIRPGDSIEWTAAGECMRVVKVPAQPAQTPSGTLLKRLLQFDEATKRQARRQRSNTSKQDLAADRGWKREDIYDRGRPR
jgi:AbrB family looped-hinge helix DNA binding protein